MLRRTGGSDGPRILFVGGNPGVARFYAAAAQEFAGGDAGRRHCSRARGFVDGRRVHDTGGATRLAGHSTDLGGPFSVEEQIAHGPTTSTASARSPRTGPALVVVGHSIGGYLR